MIPEKKSPGSVLGQELNTKVKRSPGKRNKIRDKRCNKLSGAGPQQTRRKDVICPDCGEAFYTEEERLHHDLAQHLEGMN